MDEMTTSDWSPGSDVSAWNVGEIRGKDEDQADGEELSTNSTSDLLWIYIAPCILLTGICGNTLVLLVLGKGRLRGTSTCVYLLTMAIADLVAIITGVVPDWLTAQGETTIKEVHPVFCKAEKFLSYTSADTSIWACVAFTIDRFVAVCFPMDCAQLCPPQNAKYYALAVFLAAISKNLHVFATRGQQMAIRGNETVVVSNCGSPNDAFGYFEKYVRPWIAFTVVNLIPFVVIVFCNLFIVRAMIRLRRSYQQQSVIASSKDSNTTIQMTVLCLSASICFLVCVTPSMILLIGKPYWLGDPSYVVAKAVANLIYYVNHSINFFLYCLTGGKFRAELRALFSRTAPSGPRSSLCRYSIDTIHANKLQKDRLSQLSGNASGHYSSTPCISNLVDGEKVILRGPSSTVAAEKNLSGHQSSAMGDRLKTSSDPVLLNSSGLSEKHSRV